VTKIAAESKLAPWPFFADDEVAAVTRVLRSGRVNYWTGDEGRAFEAEYAAHCGVKHGLAVANGTLALELALYALGIGPGDEVIVPARTFVATAAVVVQRGAVPVVADIDPLSQNLTVETVAAALSPRTKAVIPVHLAGWPVDMAPLMAFAKEQGFKVIEDCAQAHGATDRGRPVGGIGDIGCFSFCQDKIITTGGEGGMVVTNDTAAFQRMWSFRDHGKDYARTNAGDTTPGFKWLVDSFGTNWRLTEPQSALGRVQLRKLPQWVEQRRANAAVLDTALSGLNAVTLVRPPAHAFHSYYKYYCLLTPAALKSGYTRDRIADELEKKGVPARAGSCPDISKEAAFANAGITRHPLHPNADSIADTTLMLPVHPTLTAGNMTFLAETTRAAILAATR
jgi:dTDP-4-amino-4,6-dideoxygalactose transaminase